MGLRASAGHRSRLFLTGASGLLGGRLATLLATSFEVVGAWHQSDVPKGTPSLALDLLSLDSFENALEVLRPRAVLHAAALADADRCERDPLAAFRVNAEGTARLVRACRRAGVRVVTLSTDLVLDGERGAPARETEAPAPRLVYAASKVAAEEATFAEDAGAAVARVALVHGRGHGPRSTASESIAWALGAGRPVRLFTDQFRTPVDPESLAQALAVLLAGEASGLFHLGGPERLSRHDLGLRTAAALGLPTHLIEPTTSSHAPGAARPRDVSLDSSRAVRELGYAPRPLDEALRESRRAPA